MEVNLSIAEYDRIFSVSSYETGILMLFLVLVLGVVANMALLWSLFTGDRRSRLRPFLINLAVAGLMVCCFTIAMELGSRLTVTWRAGDVACRLFSLTKTLGLYLEAFVVLVMSVDRCYVVLFPLRISGHAKRTKTLLITAWIAATVFSIPQAVVFHVENHADFPEFPQCAPINSFANPTAENAYVLFGILALYVVPLVIIISTSIIVLVTIHSSPKNICTRNSSEEQAEKRGKILSHQLSLTTLPEPAFSLSDNESTHLQSTRVRFHTDLQLCHSDTIMRRKAKSRTSQLSILIVMAFVLCYTPYAVMISVAFLIGRHLIDDNGLAELTEGLLMLSLGFSTVMNPLVYGAYALHTRKRLLKLLNSSHKSSANVISIGHVTRYVNSTDRSSNFLLNTESKSTNFAV